MAAFDWLLTVMLGLLSSSLLTLKDDYFSVFGVCHHLQTEADDFKS